MARVLDAAVTTHRTGKSFHAYRQLLGRLIYRGSSLLKALAAAREPLPPADPLPEVGDETLEAYHEYFSKNLVFPFTAEYGTQDGYAFRIAFQFRYSKDVANTAITS